MQTAHAMDLYPGTCAGDGCVCIGHVLSHPRLVAVPAAAAAVAVGVVGLRLFRAGKIRYEGCLRWESDSHLGRLKGSLQFKTN